MHTLRDLVEDYFYNVGNACGECDFQYSWRESRGEFWGQPCTEVLNGCRLLDEKGRDVRDCPAVPDLLGKAHELTEPEC